MAQVFHVLVKLMDDVVPNVTGASLYRAGNYLEVTRYRVTLLIN